MKLLPPIALGSVLAACTTTTTTTPAASVDPAVPAAEEGEAGPAVEAYTEAEVQALFDKRCTKCHNASNGLLDLSAPFTRETVGVATATGGRNFCASSEYVTRIVPGNREMSLLWHKVKGTHDCGSPMPYDKGNKKLDATELERLGLWIDGLAH